MCACVLHWLFDLKSVTLLDMPPLVSSLSLYSLKPTALLPPWYKHSQKPAQRILLYLLITRLKWLAHILFIHSTSRIQYQMWTSWHYVIPAATTDCHHYYDHTSHHITDLVDEVEEVLHKTQAVCHLSLHRMCIIHYFGYLTKTRSSEDGGDRGTWIH